MELVWLACALVGGIGAVKLRLPVFVGYLVVGIALGLAGHQPSERLTAAGDVGVLLLLLMAALLAVGSATLFDKFHLSAELGAVAAGALAATQVRGKLLASRLWGLKEFLLVGFFLGIGMRVSQAQVDWGYVALFTFLLPWKTWLFLTLLVALGLRARTAFLTGAGLTSYSEFALIAGAAAASHGLLQPNGLAVLTLTTVVSFVLYMPVNRLSYALYDRFRDVFDRLERDSPHPDDPSPSIGAAHYLVLGMGRTGTAAYDFLHASGERVVGIDTDHSVLAAHLPAGRRVAYGDAQDDQLWRSLDLTRLAGAVVALPSDEARLRVARLLRRHAPQAVISVYAMQAQEADALRGAGADNVSYLLAEAGERMAELSLGAADGATRPRPGSPPDPAA